ncbi:hypothetical protein PIB30_087129 [Stylosanthes scabra]|uniref:Uncharacterized protein n=1 Tax=Stylosanthes scabra TaxID=79078 RepID=A0ABU6WV48_9FABA|nr:hypothetical protein [Stylosanthes scabra]
MFAAGSAGHQANIAKNSQSQPKPASSICNSCATEFRELLNKIMMMFGETYGPLVGRVHNCESMVTASHVVLLEIRDRVNKISQGAGDIFMVPTPTNKTTQTTVGCDNEGNMEDLLTSHSTDATGMSAPTTTPNLPGKHATNAPATSNGCGMRVQWSRGIGKVASTASCSKKRANPLAESHNADAERFKKTRSVDDSVACKVLAGVRSGKPPRHPNTPLVRSTWVAGLSPLRKGPDPVHNSEDCLVYKPGMPGQAMQNPNEAQLIPLDFPMVLRPTAAMGFKREQCKFAAYVFQDKVDDKANHMSEVLFKAGKFEISREQFHSLRPGKVIDAAILKGACKVASRLSSQTLVIKQWFLPWTFARDVLNDMDESKVMQKFEGEWMPITFGLLRVIIPIIDEDDTWFLMFFDIKRRQVYSLDVSRTAQTTMKREKYMEKILEFMGGVFRKDRNIGNFPDSIVDFRRWEYFLYPKGMPTNIARYESAVWCLSWIMHHNAFARNVLDYAGTSEYIQLRLAIGLASTKSNDLHTVIDSKAETLWRSKCTPKSKDIS